LIETTIRIRKGKKKEKRIQKPFPPPQPHNGKLATTARLRLGEGKGARGAT